MFPLGDISHPQHEVGKALGSIGPAHRTRFRCHIDQAVGTLGEPLSAEIEIVSLAPGEDEALSARLAGADLFAQAGIDVNPALNTVRVSIERRDKRPYLRVTTRDPIRSSESTTSSLAFCS